MNILNIYYFYLINLKKLIHIRINNNYYYCFSVLLVSVSFWPSKSILDEFVLESVLYKFNEFISSTGFTKKIIIINFLHIFNLNDLMKIYIIR